LAQAFCRQGRHYASRPQRFQVSLLSSVLLHGASLPLSACQSRSSDTWTGGPPKPFQEIVAYTRTSPDASGIEAYRTFHPQTTFSDQTAPRGRTRWHDLPPVVL